MIHQYKYLQNVKYTKCDNRNSLQNKIITNKNLKEYQEKRGEMIIFVSMDRWNSSQIIIFEKENEKHHCTNNIYYMLGYLALFLQNGTRMYHMRYD